MTWAWTAAIALNLAGALAVVVFGGLVASVRPRTAQASAVAGFAIALGAAAGFINLSIAAGPDTPAGTAIAWIAVLANLCEVAFLVRLWWMLPAPLHPEERRLLIVPALLVLPWFLLAASAIPARTSELLAPSAVSVYFAVGMLSLAAWWALLVLFALRVARTDADPKVRREAPLLAGALVLPPATITSFAFSPDEVLSPGGLLTVVCAIGMAALWIWAWARVGAPRTGRNLAWLTLGAALVGLAEGLGGVTTISTGFGIAGVARIAAVAILSYAVVRHHVLGIDVKVRWGISRSTIAAAFVATFFVASEGAQILFGQGNEWVGILGAGALVFAIAPLQRAAERLAEKAVPVATATDNESARREGIYREALRIAITDRQVSRAEDVHLFQLADELGISAGRAMRLRHEIEAERQEVSP